MLSKLKTRLLSDRPLRKKPFIIQSIGSLPKIKQYRKIIFKTEFRSVPPFLHHEFDPVNITLNLRLQEITVSPF